MPEEPDAAFKSWEMQQNSTTDIGHRYVIINDCDAPEPNTWFVSGCQASATAT